MRRVIMEELCHEHGCGKVLNREIAIVGAGDDITQVTVMPGPKQWCINHLPDDGIRPVPVALVDASRDAALEDDGCNA